jgi:hypothetical protein
MAYLFRCLIRITIAEAEGYPEAYSFNELPLISSDSKTTPNHHSTWKREKWILPARPGLKDHRATRPWLEPVRSYRPACEEAGEVGKI